jgi:hypothetical protein
VLICTRLSSKDPSTSTEMWCRLVPTPAPMAWWLIVATLMGHGLGAALGRRADPSIPHGEWLSYTV